MAKGGVMGNKYVIDYKILSQRIKEARRLKGITQEKLAELTGLSSNFIAKIESNNSTVSLQTIVSIANTLDISIDYLLLENDSQCESEASLLIKSMLKTFDEQDKDLLIDLIRAVRGYKSKQAI
jgi:transcriptional regulator with XRE-family HTH domain